MSSKFRKKTDDRYETIILTEEGKKQLENEFKNLSEEFKRLLAAKGTAFEGAVGDSWHDNAEYEHIQAKLEPVMARIDYLNEKLKHVEIIEIDLTKFPEDAITLNDYVYLNCVFGEDDEEKMIIKMVPAVTKSANDDIQEVAITSPLGEAIFKHKVGERVFYSVNGIRMSSDILARSTTIDGLSTCEDFKLLQIKK